MRVPVSSEDLKQRIFQDANLRRQVNHLMHPVILDSIRRSSAQFVEVPLLIETCLQPEFRHIWVVTCGRAEQMRRLTARVGDPLSAERIVASQLPTEVKLAFADVVVRTNRAPEDVNRFVAAVARRSVA
jgi:dephospho-CoA kinase